MMKLILLFCVHVLVLGFVQPVVSNSESHAHEDTQLIQECLNHAMAEHKLRQERHAPVKTPTELERYHQCPFAAKRSSGASDDKVVIAARNKYLERRNITHEDLQKDTRSLELFEIELEKKSLPNKRSIDCSGYAELYYRTPDASCNNLYNPYWGVANSNFQRYLPAQYDNLGHGRRLNYYGYDLPSPRHISNQYHKGLSPQADNCRTMITQGFGQFVNHDVLRTATASSRDCCDPPKVNDSYACFNYEAPPYDKLLSGCIAFGRAEPPPVPDGCYYPECFVNPENEVTAFLDLSQVYGSDLDALNELVGGTYRKYYPKLEMRDLGYGIQSLPTTIGFGGAESVLAGDFRVSQVETLVIPHTAFAAYHNLLVDQLQAEFPYWDDDKLFNQARRINTAVYQHIISTEFLPDLLGEYYNMYLERDFSCKYNYYGGYNPYKNPSIKMEFSLAFRYGHSEIMDRITFRDPNYYPLYSTPLEGNFFNVASFSNANDLQNVVRGAITDHAARDDRLFQEAIRDHLFNGDRDLVATNINRQRDVGLPSYVEYAKRAAAMLNIEDLSVFESFATLPFHTPEAASVLSSIYSHPKDIDFYSGAVSEIRVPGGAVGPTMAKILGDQFLEMKESDRFWYSNPGQPWSFSEEELYEIKCVTLAGVFASVFKLDKIQPNLFRPGQPYGYNAYQYASQYCQLNVAPFGYPTPTGSPGYSESTNGTIPLLADSLTDV